MTLIQSRHVLRRAASAGARTCMWARKPARDLRVRARSAEAGAGAGEGAAPLNKDELVRQLAQALERDKGLARQIAEELSPEARRQLGVSVVLADGNLAESEFQVADLNDDGVISKEEFAAWMVPSAARAASESRPVTELQMRRLFIITAVPMVGFGFLDNAIMITAGDLIDSSLGLTFGISTMAAAGFGNLISDVAGLGLGSYIEASATRLGIQNPGLTQLQNGTRRVQRARAFANIAGISVGCLLGMFPLLFIDQEKRELKSMFDQIDSHKDGYIRLSELDTALKKLGLELPEQALAEFMAKVDKDADGHLDFDEFCELWKRFKTDI